MTVAIVGGGVMGEAILAGALDRGVLSAGDVTVVELLSERREVLAERYGVATEAEAGDALAGASLVLLAVKPQEFSRLSGALAGDALLMSIMAGVRVETLAAHFTHDRIVRVMPNTPAAINAGMSVWTATEAVSEYSRHCLLLHALALAGRIPADRFRAFAYPAGEYSPVGGANVRRVTG